MKNSSKCNKQSSFQVECLTLKRILLGKMTYAQFAKKLGISENNLTQKINGKRRWWIDECVLAAKLLDVTDLKEVFPEILKKVENEVA